MGINIPSNIRGTVADPKGASTSALAAVLDGHYIDVIDAETFDLVQEEHTRRTDPYSYFA